MVTGEGVDGAERPDAVVVGAGAAGLSLACHLAAAGWPGRVVVIDDGAVPVDHAAWAYWSRGDQLLDPWATAGVDRLLVRSPGRDLDLTLHAYRYRRMTGRRLAEATDHLLAAAPGITRVRGTVEQIDEGPDGARVTVLLAGTGERTVLTPRWVFDSVGLAGDRPTPPAARLEFHGEHVEWDDDRVDPSAVTLMDFRTSQSDGLAFVYVLPMSRRSALVERTRFVVGSGAPTSGTADADHLARYLG
ncbi:MAG: FAD-binding protein, partial [Cellulomonadaceae bacterium]|nr:FAD-binding protein [Cellulomonadaceae bacterium]